MEKQPTSRADVVPTLNSVQTEWLIALAADQQHL
jgi:hypothetical protein